MQRPYSSSSVTSTCDSGDEQREQVVAAKFPLFAVVHGKGAQHVTYCLASKSALLIASTTRLRVLVVRTGNHRVFG
jgi:hypothetical protein